MKIQVTTKTIDDASKALEGVAKKTPLQYNKRLSEQFGAIIYFKREDLQDVRSYKIRGAYTMMHSLSVKEKERGVVCASAGNHAQGVAMSASLLKVRAAIFMPLSTPLQKINKVKQFGGSWIDVQFVGQTYDESYAAAQAFGEEKGMVFVHAFDDPRTISGQGTVAKEIVEQHKGTIDYVFCPVGGGGLISGMGIYLKEKMPRIKIIGVEPKGAPAMRHSLDQKRIVTLKHIDTFVDGAAMHRVGELSYHITAKIADKVVLADEGKICVMMIDLYQSEGIVTEPAGALAISALDQYAKEIKGKTIVCILSGGNNDILRYPEIMEKSLIYKELKHYFLVQFAQRPGQLRAFLDNALGPTDDIVRFEYVKHNSREKGPALVGIELADKRDLKPLLDKMDTLQLRYTKITVDDPLYSFLL